MNIKHYTYRVTWSPEDDKHVALCAEFPSLSWLAKTPEAALEGIQKVIAGTVIDMDANGEAAPQALAEKRYSGEFRVSISPQLQRLLQFTTGSFLEVQFLRLADPSAVIHDGAHSARSERLTFYKPDVHPTMLLPGGMVRICRRFLGGRPLVGSSAIARMWPCTQAEMTRCRLETHSVGLPHATSPRHVEVARAMRDELLQVS